MKRQRVIIILVASLFFAALMILLSYIIFIGITHIISPEFTGLKPIFDHLWNGNK